MPTTQQMIARAEDLERRAAALRLAAAEMTDQAASNKAAVFPGYLEQARAVRQQQRATASATTHETTNGNGHHPEAAAASDEDVEALIRAALAGGPQATVGVSAYLLRHGEAASLSWTRQRITQMRDVRRIGSGPGTRWALRRTRGPNKQTTAVPSAPPEPGEPPDREALVRAALADGPTHVKEVGAYLTAHGEPLDTSWLRKYLKSLSGVRLVKHGTKNTTYELHAGARPTARPPAAKKDPHTRGVNIQAQRQRSARLLDHFTHDPKTNDQLHAEGLTGDDRRRLGGLLRHGYLKMRADGWVRTAKVYTP